MALARHSAAPWVAALLGAHRLGAPGSVGYLRASAAGLPFLYLSYAGNGHLIGLADTRTPLRIAVAANRRTSSLNGLMVYGLTSACSARRGAPWPPSWPPPRCTPPRPAPGPRAARQARPDRSHRPAAGRAPAVGPHDRARRGPLTTTAIAARLGPVALGGQQIAMRVWYLLALLLDALAVPAQVYVSSSPGRGDSEGARRVGRRTLRLGLAAGLGLGVVTAALAFGAPALFTADPAVRHAATVALAGGGADPARAALAFVLDGLILGLSDYVAMRRAMILAIGAYVPMAALVLRFPMGWACPGSGSPSACGWRVQGSGPTPPGRHVGRAGPVRGGEGVCGIRCWKPSASSRPEAGVLR